jgi:hypothetical protein
MDQYIKDHASNLTESDKHILLQCKEIQERVKKLEKNQTVQKGDDKARRKAIQHDLLEHNKKKRKLEETVKDAEFKLNEVKKGVRFELGTLGEFKCDHKFASDVELNFNKKNISNGSLFGSHTISPSPVSTTYQTGGGFGQRSAVFGFGGSPPALPKQCIYCDRYV